MNLSLIPLGWAENWTAVIVGVLSSHFPRLYSWVLWAFHGGIGCAGKSRVSHWWWLSPAFTPVWKWALAALRAVGTGMCFIWPAQCLDVFHDALGWFAQPIAPHTRHHSLLSIRSCFIYLHHFSGPWGHWAAASNKSFQTLLSFCQMKTLYIRAKSQAFFLGRSHSLLGACVSWGIKVSFYKCLFFCKMMYEEMVLSFTILLVCLNFKCPCLAKQKLAILCWSLFKENRSGKPKLLRIIWFDIMIWAIWYHKKYVNKYYSIYFP